MPRQSMTPFTYYSFRYDYTTIEMRDKILDFIKRECPKYAIFDEISSVVTKNHIQGKIGKCLSDEQLRKHFRDAFPNVFCKTNYSLAKIREPPEYDSYMCKDGNALINNVFTEEYILEQVLKHKEILTKIETKEVRKTKSFTEDVAEEFMLKNPHQCHQIINEYTEYKPDKSVTIEAKKFLLGFLLKRLGKVAKVFDDNVLQRMYNGVKNYIIMNSDLPELSGYIKTFENRIVL